MGLNSNMLKPIAKIREKFIQWKSGTSDDYVYDNCHEFFNELNRSELLVILDYIENNV